MRIYDWNPLQTYKKIQDGRPSAKPVDQPSKRVTGGPAAPSVQSTGDRLEISAEAQVKSHTAAWSGHSEVQTASAARQARVEALRQQVQAGTYDVPAELVARKMLQALIRRS